MRLNGFLQSLLQTFPCVSPFICLLFLFIYNDLVTNVMFSSSLAVRLSLIYPHILRFIYCLSKFAVTGLLALLVLHNFCFLPSFSAFMIHFLIPFLACFFSFSYSIHHRSCLFLFFSSLSVSFLISSLLSYFLSSSIYSCLAFFLSSFLHSLLPSHHTSFTPAFFLSSSYAPSTILQPPSPPRSQPPLSSMYY